MKKTKVIQTYNRSGAIIELIEMLEEVIRSGGYDPEIVVTMEAQE